MAAVINLKVKSDFSGASADLAKFGTVTEAQRKKIEAFQKQFKDENIKQFNDRLKRSTAAVKATRGPLAALKSEHRGIQKEIERLIRRGIDPLDDSIKSLTSQYKKLDKEMEDINRQAKANQKAAKATQGAMLALGAGAVVMGKRAVDAFIDISKESAQAASDAEEIQGKFNVVFGAIANDAAMAASTIAEDFDLAASTVNKLLGDSGDILTGLGFDPQTALELSEAAGTLALDLASFTNFAGGAEGASAALTKAMLGEAESAKALGIVIRQDTQEYKDMIESIQAAEGVGLTQAKALAALQIATEQSKNAIGDYARTSDSSANVQKRLNETIKEAKELYGNMVNEGLTPWRAGITDTIAEINKLIKTQILQNKVEAGEATTVEQLILQRQQLAEAEATLERKTQTLNATIEQGNTVTDAQLSRQRSSRDAIDKRAESMRKSIAVENERIATITEAIGETEKQVQIENEAAQAAIDAATRADTLSRIEAEAAAELARLKFEALGQDEKALASLDAQIEKWREYEEVNGVNETINALLEKRALLLAGHPELLETNLTAEQEAADERLSILLSEEQAIAERDLRISEMKTEARILEKEALDLELEEEAARAEKRKGMWISLGNTIVSAIGSAFNLVGIIQQRRVDKQISNIDKALEREIGAITEATDTRTDEQKKIDKLVEAAERKKAKLQYDAALKTYKLQLAMAIVSGAAAILMGFAQLGPIPGAIAAIGTAIVTGIQIATIVANKPQAPAFAEGGRFTTNGPQLIKVGDNLGGREEVTVNPVSSTGFNQRSGIGGGKEEMILNIDGSRFRAWLTKEFKNGNILVDSRAVV